MQLVLQACSGAVERRGEDGFRAYLGSKTEGLGWLDVGKEEQRSRTTSSCLARGAECCSRSDAVSSVEEFKGKNHLEAEFEARETYRHWGYFEPEA